MFTISHLVWLIVHLLLGYRRFRDTDYYRSDPMVQRVTQMKSLPSVPTASRMLGEFDSKAVSQLRRENRNMVIERLRDSGFARATMDFDGSVLSTKRRAEGAAVGFNRKRKGSRSYYPLFCTVAQTGQVLDVLPRSGNVHDSNGAVSFLGDCYETLANEIPGIVLESRMDSAFFSDPILDEMESFGVGYSVSVPFERFPELKEIIEKRKRWKSVGKADEASFFELDWKPKSWSRKRRMICVRQFRPKQRKEPLQLDLFEPVDYEFDYKVIVTNKSMSPRKICRFHEGRGSQEGILGEMKSQLGLDYIPAKRRCANEVFLMANVIAHNLSRELQMQSRHHERVTSEKRAAQWIFEGIETLRKKVIQRAGRFTRPQGILTLTLNQNQAVKSTLTALLKPQNL